MLVYLCYVPTTTFADYLFLEEVEFVDRSALCLSRSTEGPIGELKGSLATRSSNQALPPMQVILVRTTTFLWSHFGRYPGPTCYRGSLPSVSSPGDLWPAVEGGRKMDTRLRHGAAFPNDCTRIHCNCPHETIHQLIYQRSRLS
jgi:hypothetical protein